MSSSLPSSNSITLLIDADDTLWENNIYFERAISSFISFLNHREFSPAQVREVLNEVERECIISHGYGLHSFTHALVQTFERLTDANEDNPITTALRETIHGFAQTIAEQPIELLPEVPETLQYLSERHHVVLMTKGALMEQSGKIERSGLKEQFAEIEIVAEKSRESYEQIVAKHSMNPASTWMIGNSPKSDINPALEAGLNAVFVPHDNTWILEHETIGQPQPPRELLVLERFGQLRDHF